MAANVIKVWRKRTGEKKRSGNNNPEVLNNGLQAFLLSDYTKTTAIHKLFK